MFEFISRRKNPHRRKVASKYIDARAQLRHADKDARRHIRHAVDIANTKLVRTHSSLSRFFSLPEIDQLDYIGHLGAAAAEMKRTDPLTGAGFELYKMWLLANIEQNQQRIDQLTEELQLV
ncbi:hypothetical protein N9H39_08105 [Gammaproteobacteria bacterium]|nr:hypothetical protein [Gammaproteobacteria bacterium]